MTKARRFSAPSLTPMIDVVFLLLLFFLLSSQFKTQETLRIAVAGEAAQANEVDLQLVELGKQMRLNGIDVTEHEFISHLVGLQPNKTSFAIRSDQEVTYGEVVKMIDQIRSMGFENVVLVEKQNED